MNFCVTSAMNRDHMKPFSPSGYKQPLAPLSSRALLSLLSCDSPSRRHRRASFWSLLSLESVGLLSKPQSPHSSYLMWLHTKAPAASCCFYGTGFTWSLIPCKSPYLLEPNYQDNKSLFSSIFFKCLHLPTHWHCTPLHLLRYFSISFREIL